MKKKKIIFVSGSVFPNASATGNICFQIAKELSKKYEIHIISMLNAYPSEKEVTTNEGIKISINSNMWFSLRHLFASSNNRLGLNIIRAADRLFTLFFVPKNTWWYAKKVRKLISSEAKLNQDLCVISFSEPFEAHWGVHMARKKHNFKWISVFEDSFAVPLNKKNLFMNMDRLAKIEKTVIREADHVFVTPEIFDNRSDFYRDFTDKVEALPYLIKNNVSENKVFEESYTRMTYAGRFYKDMRPPEPLLDFFMDLKMDDVVLDLFTAGEGENVIKKYSESSDGKIRLKNMVNQEQLFKEYAQSDILINMENNVKEFKPSKQYEYIGTGKPIISFYYFEPDSELAKYPLALQINTHELKGITETAKTFIKESKGKSLTFDEIADIYKENTMQYVVSLLETHIGK